MKMPKRNHNGIENGIDLIEYFGKTTVMLFLYNRNV